MNDRIRRVMVLGSFMGINAIIQTLWISYAPVSGAAAAFYHVDDMAVGNFAMVFMLAFLPLSLPVSWAIDRFGFRKPVSVGALLMAAGALGRGLSGSDYTMALLASMLLAVSQPFLLNAWTKVPSRWFPRNRRAFAVGLITLANLAGTALGMVLPPLFLESGMTIPAFQTGFGVAAAVLALAFILLAREAPEVPVEEAPVRVLMGEGLRNALVRPPFWMALGISFAGLGIFNGATTWVEAMIRPRGFDPGDAGLLGVLMIVGGLAGALVLPALSDREGLRRKYLVLSLAGSIPGLGGLCFATHPVLLFGSATILGFFLVSAMPLTMQYAAEITRPTPEGTSNGLLQLCGQGSVVFVWLMAVLRTPDGSFTPGLVAAMVLLAVCLGLTFLMPEPSVGPVPEEGKSSPQKGLPLPETEA